jgi:hypothetical protein
MGRTRRTAVAVGLFVCLSVALLGSFPAVAWRLVDTLSATSHDVVATAQAPRVHRGTRVRITGTVQGLLSPGVSSPIGLSFTNPNRHKVSMRRVKVTITGVLAPRADAAHPCTTADFEIWQMPRRQLRIPKRRTVDLVALGVPTSSWPNLTMRNLPVNQDGCKGAQLSLRFRAHALRRR